MRQVYHSPLLMRLRDHFGRGNRRFYEPKVKDKWNKILSSRPNMILALMWLSAQFVHKSSPQSNTEWGTNSWASSLTEEFLMVDGFWGKALHFLLRVWLLVSRIHSCGCTHSENYMCSINWRRWVITFFKNRTQKWEGREIGVNLGEGKRRSWW